MSISHHLADGQGWGCCLALGDAASSRAACSGLSTFRG